MHTACKCITGVNGNLEKLHQNKKKKENYYLKRWEKPIIGVHTVITYEILLSKRTVLGLYSATYGKRVSQNKQQNAPGSVCATVRARAKDSCVCVCVCVCV